MQHQTDISNHWIYMKYYINVPQTMNPNYFGDPVFMSSVSAMKC